MFQISYTGYEERDYEDERIFSYIDKHIKPSDNYIRFREHIIKRLIPIIDELEQIEKEAGEYIAFDEKYDDTMWEQFNIGCQTNSDPISFAPFDIHSVVVISIDNTGKIKHDCFSKETIKNWFDHHYETFIENDVIHDQKSNRYILNNNSKYRLDHRWLDSNTMKELFNLIYCNPQYNKYLTLFFRQNGDNGENNTWVFKGGIMNMKNHLINTLVYNPLHVLSSFIHKYDPLEEKYNFRRIFNQWEWFNQLE